MNDHAWRADLLAEKLNERGRGWVHVNPIPLNPTPGYAVRGSSGNRVRTFRSELERLGVNVTVRDTRGSEIDAACGQLRAGHEATPVNRPRRKVASE